MDGRKVLLLSMPYGALERPSLGLSLLKSRLGQQQIECDLIYFTFILAEYIGYEEYRWLSADLPYTAFAGDWTFVPSLYGPLKEHDDAYVERVLRGGWQLDDNAILRLQQIRDIIPHFISHCLEAIDWNQYDVVGFTSTFEQNIASLALAQHIKHRHPEIFILFGGANWEDEMGLALHQKFPFVDFSFSGHAEESLVQLLEQLFSRGKRKRQFDTIKGLVYRKGHKSVFTGPTEPIDNLDDLPVPDYSDYFSQLHASSAATSVVPVLLLETSRGCWWGAKNQCTFCGLNGNKVSYRSKSPRRVLEELDYLVATWGVEFVEAVDNMLDLTYFDEVFPELARRRDKVSMFYEVKANLTREQVKMLSDAGVDRIQPGIESLSNHILQLMRKGTTALINIQLLKWCREYDVSVDWNLLYGFPGETKEDYEYILSLLPAIRFLGPLPTCGPVRMDRFSPYFNNAAQFGLVNVRPLESYRYIYPFEEESRARMASCFDFDYKPEVDPRGYAEDVVRYIDYYKHEPELGTLVWLPDKESDSLILFDSRSEAVCGEYRLSGYQKQVYGFCDACRSTQKILSFLENESPDVSIAESELILFLQEMVQRRFMITDGEKYLSLALPARQQR